MMKYHIVGVEKCGTQSLREKLINVGHEVVCHEWLYPFKKGPEFHNKYFPDHVALFILRNPIERCFSDYRYAVNKNQIKEMSLAEALKKFPRFAQGSCYDKWLDFWSDSCYIQVLHLEDIGRSMHVTNARPKSDKTPFTTEDMELIAREINKAKDVEYYRDDLDLEKFKNV
jgi:hypothetical protein